MKSAKAVILLSGGLDSSTVLAIAHSQQFELYALTVEYGQRNTYEHQAAQRQAQAMGVKEHRCIKIDLGTFGGSSLTTEQPVERNRSEAEIGQGVPSTYVPVRNTLFLSYALAWAEVLEAQDIFIGVNAVDTSGYPDCRPAFIEAFERLANLATKLATTSEKTIRIHAPLQQLDKSQIIGRGLELGVDYSLTNTCYDPDTQGIACGTCDACILRQRGFHKLGIEDPLPYQNRLATSARQQN